MPILAQERPTGWGNSRVNGSGVVDIQFVKSEHTVALGTVPSEVVFLPELHLLVYLEPVGDGPIYGADRGVHPTSI